MLLGFIYVFYTVPLTLATQLVDPETFKKLFPDVSQLDHFDVVSPMVSGMLTAGIWSAFFTVCPVMFQVGNRWI